MRLLILFLSILISVLTICSGNCLTEQCHITKRSVGSQSTSEYWKKLARDSLDKSKKLVNSKIKKAKNVILFLGDGMGMPSISAARLLKRQLENNTEANLAFEKLDYVATIQTYNLDYPVPDSAGTGTAYCCGVKANRGTIGVNGNVKLMDQNCDNIQKNKVTSVYEKAEKAGKSVGIVSTASITDASPAATYSHVSNRNDECSVSWKNATTCKDIARQLIEDHKFNVILGGGKRNFLPQNNTDSGRKDDIDLFKLWTNKMNDSKLEDEQFKIVYDRKQLLDIDTKKVDFLFGSFSLEHMKFDKERKSNLSENEEPSLKEMTKAAIEILSKNKKGYFLFVEGAKIDKAHHSNLAYYSLYDLLAFDEAISEAIKITNPDETLIIVTADHSHSFTHNGGSKTEDDVFGFSGETDVNGRSFTSLLYSTGPGAINHKENETEDDILKPDYQQLSAVPLESASHGGDDVAAYASGPGANMLRGNQEQVMIAHLMEFSACIGDYEKEFHCSGCSTATASIMSLLVIFHIIKLILF